MTLGEGGKPVSFLRLARTSGAGPRGARRLALLAAGGIVSGLCLWLAIRRVSLGDVWSSLEDMRWEWLVPTLLLTYLTLLARAIRWRFLFTRPELVPTWESTKAVNVGLMFNNILPSRAGEVPRALALARATGLSKVEIGTTIVVERLLDVLSVVVAALIAWPWFPHARWIHALCIISAFLLLGFVLGGAALWLLRRRARSLAELLLVRVPFVSKPRAAALADSLARGARILADPRRLVVALLLSAVVWVLAGLSVLALYPGFHLGVHSSSAWLILVATSLAMTVPSTPGALGVYEAAVQASLVAAGVAAGQALSFALVLHAVNFLPVSLTGALLLWSTVGGRREPVAASGQEAR